MPRTLAIIVADLMFQPKIEDAARALGLETRVAARTDDIPAALAGVGAVVVDLHAPFDAIAVVRRAAAAGLPVLAFGRHTEPALLRAARAAGARAAVARSELVERLPQLLASLTETAPTDSSTA